MKTKTAYDKETLIGSIQQVVFNKITANSSEDKSVVQLFEECVENYGNHIAVYSHNDCLSYRDLNTKANLLANYLRKCGAKPNTIVAIYLERSIELIISILATIKAGCAYLPIDIRDPGHRISTILENSLPIKILTTDKTINSLQDFLSTDAQKKIVNIDTFFEKQIEKDSHNPDHVNSHNDLIYVMYTSGSTGIPKGCLIPHYAVVRLVKNTNYIKIDSNEKIGQIANVAFDAMTFEMWGALLNGASLHIISHSTLLSPRDFASTLKSKEISILFITTALFNLMMKESSDAFDNLKYLLFGGEKASVETVKTLIERKQILNLSHLNIIHAYGPTECTTFATTFNIGNINEINTNVPIGKPISNTKLYILNENLEPVSEGITGELYLGGNGLALGYLNAKEETKAKFIQSPWNKQERIYKTGDLVYWQTGIGLIFVDRIDRQVKIHGFRIELNEIENCFFKFPTINQVAALVENELEEKKLVVYVSFTKGTKVDFSKLYQFLKENLPYYMIPKKIVKTDYIPYNANGKIDKKQLAMLQGKNLFEDNTSNAPIMNNVEKIVAEIWKQILSVSKINTTQNLFELGASSLMLTEACALLNAKLKDNGISEISILDIIANPTIHLLAEHINQQNKENKVGILEATTHRANLQRQKLIYRKNRYAD